MLSSLIPLGCELDRAGLSGMGELGISGARYPRALAPLQRRFNVCSLERAVVRLPRCSEACYSEEHICEAGLARPYVRKRLAGGESFKAFKHCGHNQVKGRTAWRSAAALDNALGFPIPPRARRAAPMQSSSRRVLHILFAQRAGRRYILNLDNLMSECAAASFPGGWSLNCTALRMGSLAPEDLVRTMRTMDCFVGMHGGDMVHGIHLLPGRTVVELLNFEFRNARWDWRNQHKEILEPVMRFRRILLQPPGGEVRAASSHLSHTSDWASPAVLAQTKHTCRGGRSSVF